MTWRLLTCSSLVLGVCFAGSAVHGTVRLFDSREKSVEREHDYSGVFIWLEPAPGRLPPHPAAALRATMLQKGKRFIPHILAIQKGTTVDFPNQDPIFHNAFSSF